MAQGTHLPLARPARAPDFAGHLRRAGAGQLRREAVTTLQINVGKRCNQACHHCHVEAGPKRTEVMSDAVLDRVLSLLEASPEIDVVDVTGGAPELHPRFRDLVRVARGSGREVIDRCNLTILSEPGMEDLAEFLATQRVHVIASLPCYQEGNVDGQRGSGVFARSIAALRRLNGLGYGRGGTGLGLDLVYNPTGAFLPPPQQALEARYKQELAERFGVVFDRLLTITNMPIRRFLHTLEREGKTAEYMTLLVQSFNPQTLPGLMCRSLVSVGYDGRLYDCDFNQMLEIDLGAGEARGVRTVWELDAFDALKGRPIATGSHCFGCTAGAGSSCGGALSA